MEQVPLLCGLALTAAFTCLLLRKAAPVMALTVSLAAGVLIVLRVLPELTAVAEHLRFGDTANSFLPVCLRITVLGLVGQGAASLCRDAGETGLAEKLEFAVKLAVLGLSLPYLEQVISLAEAML